LIGSLRMNGRADSGIEIRRILLLTRLQGHPKGMTMDQLVKDCRTVEGWDVAGTRLLESVRRVLQSLINDGLVTVKTRFLITAKGEEYLEDPLRWNLKVETTEDVERSLFWNSIYQIFDKAFARLRTKSATPDNKTR
jgi:hypothetical protein